MAESTDTAPRSNGRALVVGAEACRALPAQVLQRLGYQTVEFDDPYSAMAELCRRPLAYRAIALSLSSLFREEIQVVASIRRRFSHVEIWLSHIDGRAAAVAEATQLGATGLLSEEGVHRFTPAAAEPSATLPPEVEDQPRRLAAPPAPAPASTPASPGPASAGPDAILTADELRALLEEPPDAPGLDQA